MMRYAELHGNMQKQKIKNFCDNNWIQSLLVQ